ncbi:DNA polymerase III, delta prime subunit [gamma proteobacterium HTCC5015]|nr:DNA polymerase III, delta prime subunit [gamma proteobacterium HTCC5015]
MSDQESVFDLQPLSWHTPHWQSVAEQREQGRLPHALLLQGAAGVGKGLFARQLARGLLCQNAAGVAACGQCQDCHLSAIGQHPDWHEVTFERTKEGKLSREIRVDQIRALSDSLSLKSHSAGGKVAVIYPAHKMNVNAANSVLKTLEEPSADTFLLLVTDAPSRLLPTIRSRCQSIRFDVPSADQAEQWLASVVADQSPQALLAMSGGAPLLARQAAEEGWLDERETWFEQLLDIARGKLNPVDAAAAAAGMEVAASRVLEWTVSFCSDLIRLVQKVPDSVQNKDHQSTLAALAEHRFANSPQPLYRWCDDLLKAGRYAESASLNAQQLFEDVLLQWQDIQHR